MPGPWSTTSMRTSEPTRVASSRTSSSAGECRTALCSRLATTWCSRSGSAGTVRSGGSTTTGNRSRLAPPTSVAPSAASSRKSCSRTSAICSGHVARLEARQVQQVRHQPAEPFRLRERGLHRRRVRLRDAVDDVLELGLQRRDRGAQLVRDVGDELAAERVGLLEVVGHGVERVRELAHLVQARRAHPLAVVARRHPPRGVRHLAQRGRHATRQQLRDDQGPDDRDRERARRPQVVVQPEPRDERRRGDRRGHQHAELDLDRAQAVQRPDVREPRAGTCAGCVHSPSGTVAPPRLPVPSLGSNA